MDFDLAQHWKPTPKNLRIRRSPATNRLRVGGTGSSKALAIDTPILTPSGFTAIRDLNVGDTVFDDQGKPCSVTAITPTMFNPSFRLRFDTGEEIVADEGHQWHTFTFRERRQISRRDDVHRAERQRTRLRKGTAQSVARTAYAERRKLDKPKGGVRTSADIAQTVVERGHVNHAVPLCGPLSSNDRRLALDPYAFGVWLGDGTQSTGVITTADAEVLEEFARLGLECRKTTSAYGYRVEGLTSLLRGIFGEPIHKLREKCVPDDYLYSSESQRMSLLQGLMDTDGCATALGNCTFSNTNRNLIKAVHFLACSLGLKPTIREGIARCNGKDCGTVWTVAWTSDVPVFRLKRKLIRLRSKRRSHTQSFRYITSAEYVGEQEVCCISVDSPSRLYLAGKSLIPTHNSSDALMEALEYMLRYDGIAVLFIRRQLVDLKKSSILDWHNFVPKELYHWNGSDFVATLKHNGSKLFFGHLPQGSERDLQQYLSAAFPVIILDECGQFSGESWGFLSSRNRINRECKADSNGDMPVPVMLGCTNPIGPYWPFYKAQFVDKKPYEPPEDARRDKKGRYFVPDSREPAGWRLIYNPNDWDYIHSTILDNPYLMERDPDQVEKLKRLPEPMRSKFLSGEMDTTVGQYFDCWDEKRHVIDLAADPTAIIWQPWQARWMGWDYGRSHYNAEFWFTIALVRKPDGEYAEKCVCYREYIDRNKTSKETVPATARMNAAGLPHYSGKGDTSSLRTIFFSHEKFSISGERKEKLSVAERISKRLRTYGLPSLTPNEASPGSRVKKALATYEKLANDEVVVLRTCVNLIEAIPAMVRDEDNYDDVLKIDGKADDCYDGFTMGLYNMDRIAKKPKLLEQEERLAAIPDFTSRAIMERKFAAERKSLRRYVQQ